MSVILDDDGLEIGVGSAVTCRVLQQWCLSLSSVLMLCNLLLAWLMVQQQIFQGKINYKFTIHKVSKNRAHRTKGEHSSPVRVTWVVRVSQFQNSIYFMCHFRYCSWFNLGEKFTSSGKKRQLSKFKCSMLSTGWQEEQYFVALYINKCFLIAVLIWSDYQWFFLLIFHVYK